MAEKRIWRRRRSRQSLRLMLTQVLGNSRQKPEADIRRQPSIVSQDAVEKVWRLLLLS